MAARMQDTVHKPRAMSPRVEAVGCGLARYSLAAVVAWIGLLKSTAYEAKGIRPSVANSPPTSWVCEPLSVRGFSAVLGAVALPITSSALRRRGDAAMKADMPADADAAARETAALTCATAEMRSSLVAGRRSNAGTVTVQDRTRAAVRLPRLSSAGAGVRM